MKRDSPNGSKTTTALEKNEIGDIHVIDNISDGFHEIPMKYFPKKTKRTSCRELLNKLKSLSHNPNVPEEYFGDLEIHDLLKLVELLKRNTLADHRFVVEENNTSYQKNNKKALETLLNMPVPPKRQKLSGRVGKGNKVRKYFTSIKIKIPKNLNMTTNFHNKKIAFKNKNKKKIIEKVIAYQSLIFIKVE